MSQRKTEPRKHVSIYTDGCARGNPGPGGYGVVLLFGEHRKELSGGFRLTTNNRMEVLAAIAALAALKEPCRVTLHTDSEYLVYGAASAETWKKQGWRLHPPKTKRAANRDLWNRLLTLCRMHEVTFEWVKGHASEAENVRCDRLANEAAAGRNLAADQVYETENPAERPFTEEELLRMAAANPQEKITREGQPCRKCGHAVERRVPRPRAKQRAYRYEYYFLCPRCRTMYLAEEAKRFPGDLAEGDAASMLFDAEPEKTEGENEK
jgi:ribonuclease HI